MAAQPPSRLTPLPHGALMALAALAALFGVATASAAQDLPRMIIAPVQGVTGKLSPAGREAVRARIEEGVAATGAFAIDTRLEGELDALLDEAAIARRAGEMSNAADFIVFPYIDGLDIDRVLRPVPGLEGKYNARLTGAANLRVRVVSARTSALKTSFQVDVAVDESLGVRDAADVRPSAPRATQVRVASDEEVVRLARLISDSVAEQIYDGLYPPEVAEVQGDTVWVTRGSRGGYRIGDRYKVFSAGGKPIYHPVSKKQIGVAETQLGIIEITDVRDDFSIARVIEQTNGAIVAGAVVRQ